MDIVYTPVWQDPGAKRSALQFVQDEIFLMEQVEGLGFDVCCSPEHHFDIDYSACPDNFMPLAYLAAKTTTLKLCLGAVILPWNDPLRVVEKLAFLDHLSNGRCIAGFGRGLSKMEYAHFGIPMDESRDRFDEALPMVVDALRTGMIAGDGKYYKQAATPIHPKPRASMADEFCSVGMSPDSATVAGQVGAKLLSFITKPTPEMMPLFNCYFDAFRANHPDKTPHIIMDDFYMVRDSADEALDLGMKYTTAYYRTVIRHYEIDGDHFAKLKGYAAYAAGAEELKAAGIEAAAEAYVKAQLGVGTPRQILERLDERLNYLGPDISLAGCFFYGGMSRDQAHESLKLFSAHVIPAAKALAREHKLALVAA